MASTFVWILSYWTTANGGTNVLAGSLSGIFFVYGTGYDGWIFYGPYAFVDFLEAKKTSQMLYGKSTKAYGP